MIRTKLIQDAFTQHPPKGMTSEQAAGFFQDWLTAQHGGDWRPSRTPPAPIRTLMRDENGNASRQASINVAIGMLDSVIGILQPVSDDPMLQQAVEHAIKAKTTIIQAKNQYKEQA